MEGRVLRKGEMTVAGWMAGGEQPLQGSYICRLQKNSIELELKLETGLLWLKVF